MYLIISSFALVAIAALITLTLKNIRSKALLALAAVGTAAIALAIPSIQALCGQKQELICSAGAFFGHIRLSMDALSAWFSLMISVVFCSGAVYAWGYLQHYLDKKQALSLHIFAYLLAYMSMQMLCVVQHSLAFLIVWEIMALSSFIVIIFESWKDEVMKAGINFFIQSHVGVVLLTLGFLMLSAKSGSFDFASFKTLSSQEATSAYVLLFLGFAVKAGLLPFHTWLPHAHPAAPAHISGVMSGVIIKIGIFGMLRMLSFVVIPYENIGYMVLALGAISGLYGIMQAIVQKNIKKLLAYSSIENIGIICMGIGLGLIGWGRDNTLLASMGFLTALLHSFNHALFKSSLFFLSGNVYHATHSLNMEHMGGLLKKMPYTALLFLLSAVAICALPPLNGFVSEFLLYNGLFKWMQQASLSGAVGASFAILSLVLIGGMAIICFSKAFGIVFLGSRREQGENSQSTEMPKIRLIPIAVNVVLMALIGCFPGLCCHLLEEPLRCALQAPFMEMPQFEAFSHFTWICLSFIALVAVLYFIRKKQQASKHITQNDTWGCGYTAPNAQLQYTGTSYVKTFAETLEGLLGFRKRKAVVEDIYPQESLESECESYDRLERSAIEKPLNRYQDFMSHFLFLQNGKLQFYMLYGIIFILITIILTFIIH